jgi:ParB/RepB/Spo0J family partition protein
MTEPQHATLEHIPLESLDAGANPRKTFTQIESLADSIARLGLLHPPLVERVGNRWRLIAGERRTRAVRLLHSTGRWPGHTIPCLVLPLHADPSLVLAQSLAENTAREALRPWDVARSVADLQRLGMKVNTIATVLGRTRWWVTHHLAIARYVSPEAETLLAELPPEMTTLQRVYALCRLLDQHGEPDVERQKAMIRAQWRHATKRGVKPGGVPLDRRRTEQRIAVLRAQLVPALPPAPRRAVEAVIAFLESPGSVGPFDRWDSL